MKRVFTTFLILTFIFQIAAQFGVFLYFEANQNYIAKTQCENIKKPEMHCDGQCVLSKLLKKTEQEKENKKAFNSRVLDALVHPDTNFEFINLVVELKNEKAFFKPAFLINPPTSIFHPPPIS
ncbi:hypothetical protein [Pedobacter arcticus]|uniref:hypothetical protein n=1 Tax=Pedobacter arcticus TaxID=752140 RepID=UPI0003089679|nr:hypothetical protein [Pedobacter arcticus]